MVFSWNCSIFCFFKKPGIAILSRIGEEAIILHKTDGETGLQHLDFVLLDMSVMQICFQLMYWIMGHQGIIYADPAYRIQAIIFFSAQMALGLTSDAYSLITVRSRFKEFSLMNAFFLEMWLLGGIFILLVGIPVRFNELLLATGMYYNIDYFGRMGLKTFHLKRGLPVRKVVVVTTSALAESALKRVQENTTSYRYQPVCAVLMDDKNRHYFDWGIRVFRASDSLLIDEIGQWWIDDAFVLLDEDTPYPKELMNTFLIMGITVHSSLSVLDSSSFAKTGMQELGHYKVLTKSVNLVSGSALFLKRAADIVGGLIGCFITLLLTLFIGPAIYIKSPGPIFFKQKRVGRNGKVFFMYKFRSMYLDAEKRKTELMEKNKMKDSLMFKIEDDPRIIGSEKKGKDGKPRGIGNFIRNTSLDEFPQFFNVLKGDMSLVGTRPPTLDEWYQYAPHHRIRMSTKPGITGLWQISGRSKITDFEQVIRLDRRYIEYWSIWMDLKILWKTMQVVIKREGAH